MDAARGIPTLVIGILTLLTTVGIAVIGYVLRGLQKDISTVDAGAKERHEANSQEIRQVEERTTRYVHDVETRAVDRVKEAETRAEKGDERVLGQVNSQYQEMRRDLREMRDDLKVIRNGGAFAAGGGD